MTSKDHKLLESIDHKLGAILVLLLDVYLRDTELAKPKSRSVDRMLADVGLSTTEIAVLLGKTDRAVQLQLAAKPKPVSKRSKPKGKK